jgi:hypothetical protein
VDVFPCSLPEGARALLDFYEDRSESDKWARSRGTSGPNISVHELLHDAPSSSKQARYAAHKHQAFEAGTTRRRAFVSALLLTSADAPEVIKQT